MEDVLLHTVSLDDQPMASAAACCRRCYQIDTSPCFDYFAYTNLVSPACCVQDVDLHPTQRLLASGVIDGHAVLHDFTDGSATQRHRVKVCWIRTSTRRRQPLLHGVFLCASTFPLGGHGAPPKAPFSVHLQAHGSSCRAVRFSGDGRLLYTASTDRSLLAVDAASGKAQARKSDAHGDAINRLATLSETGLASGDDEGVVKLWDSRQGDEVAALEAHSGGRPLSGWEVGWVGGGWVGFLTAGCAEPVKQRVNRIMLVTQSCAISRPSVPSQRASVPPLRPDYVADMCAVPSKHALLSVSGDGTLAVIDLRTHKVGGGTEPR
jgi:WD40 repeat protein